MPKIKQKLIKYIKININTAINIITYIGSVLLNTRGVGGLFGDCQNKATRACDSHVILHYATYIHQAS